jgi:membrane-bound serine protease (ClpP class)
MGLVVTLLLVGFALLLLESVVPGLILGIVGFGCVGTGVALAYLRLGVATGNWVLLFTSLALVVGIWLWIKYFPDSPVARVFVSTKQIGSLGVEQPELLNQTGAACTALRPSGTALINGHRVDVVTEGGFVEKGAPVKVVAIEGMRVVVRPA